MFELASAEALPLPPSSPFPEVAPAVAAAPVVVSLVAVVAVAPEPVTVPMPLAVIPAVTVVAPTEAPLVWLEVALMLVAPLPALAVLEVDGATDCVMAPVLESSSHEPEHDESAVVVVVSPFAVLLALGLDVIVVPPVLLLLDDDGLTVRLFPETVPLPTADGLDDAVASPPYVLLVVFEVALPVAFPLGPSSPLPEVAVAVAGAPTVVPVVVELALAPDPLTVPVPFAVIGAVTLVSPVVAVLACVAPVVIVAPPFPAEAPLLTEGFTVCVMSPVVPSQLEKNRQLEFASVFVGAPVAVLSADGDTVMDVLPVLFPLSELGFTAIVLPHHARLLFE